MAAFGWPPHSSCRQHHVRPTCRSVHRVPRETGPAATFPNVNRWTVHLTPAGGHLTGSTGTVTVTVYNGTFNPNATTAFGFIANGNSTPASTNPTCAST